MNFLLSLSRLLDLASIADEVETILKAWVGPLFTALGGVAVIYIIILAVQYAKSENDNKRVEIKSRIVNCIIGGLSLIVIGSLCFSLDWAGIVQVFGYTEKEKGLIGMLLMR